MAPKNQGIMSVAPGLVPKIIGQDQRKGLFGNIYDQSDFLSRKEFVSPGSIAAAKLGKSGTVTEGIRDILKDPYRMGTNVISNIPSVFKGIGAFLDEKTDQGRLDQAAETASNMAGVEFGLPTDKTLVKSKEFPKGENVVPKGLYDAFDTLDGGQGQERLVNTQFPDGISIQDEINNADKGTAIDDFDAGLADSTGATDGSETTDGSGENLTAAQEATKTALSEYLAQARPGVKPQKYDEYIKEFGEATGLDMSGEPDTKQALMSFGLALMQNRAGKDFDVSKILTSVGEAGEAAMPDFRKAVAESKAVRAKAGEYALGRTKEDKNAAMNRKNYYIVPKGKKGGLKGIASNLDKGQFSMLNSYELNNLTNNKEFNEEYEIVPNSTYEKVLAATIKTPEWGEKYLTKYEDIPLFNNAGDDFKIPVQRLNGNYKGPNPPKQGFFNPEKYDDYYGRFKRMDTGLNKVSDQLGKAFKISSDGKLNFGGQVADDIKGFAQAFGLSDQKATDKDQVLYILNSVAAKNAPKILGEAGKTISDSDRDRVQVIVGRLEKTSSPAALRLALQECYELIVVEGKRDIRQGLSTLNRYSGRKDPNFEKKSLSSEVNEQGVYQVSDQ